MEIQCECGRFRAELSRFPRHTPGRLTCYCDDCQMFLHHLQRQDLLDAAGGTEIIPVYPSEIKLTSGRENLKCTRLSPNGLLRWSTTCCNTPIANTRPKYPWIGLNHQVFNVNDPDYLARTLGPIRSGIMGRFATSTPPPGTASKMNARAVWSVLPFLLKGALLRKAANSPFFNEDGNTPISEPQVPTREERAKIREQLSLESRS